MEEKQQFDMEKYRNGDISVICEDCGFPIDLEKTMDTRIIAKDTDGFNIIEQFFSCNYCGTHYTITVIDHEQQKLIQKRQQIQKKIQIHTKIGSREKTIKDLYKKDEDIKEEMMKRSCMLKAKYKEMIECGK